MSCQLIHYTHEEHDKFFELCKSFDYIIVRCNPGSMVLSCQINSCCFRWPICVRAPETVPETSQNHLTDAQLKHYFAAIVQLLLQLLCRPDQGRWRWPAEVWRWHARHEESRQTGLAIARCYGEDGCQRCSLQGAGRKIAVRSSVRLCHVMPKNKCFLCPGCNHEHWLGGHVGLLLCWGVCRWFQEDHGIPTSCHQAESWIFRRGHLDYQIERREAWFTLKMLLIIQFTEVHISSHSYEFFVVESLHFMSPPIDLRHARVVVK